ncbi:hypothetical protein R1sor_006022 [Riccia sorocarpa]|uniref:SCP domain-containing protein n=1 Tax=Riccia sorocarpa TaxID=122646 RepID=A0ABD3HNA2_9MARC
MASLTTSLLMFMVFLVAMGRAADGLSWERQFTDPHNAARKAVRVVSMANLTWDWSLANYAQNWANSRASRANNCVLKHSNGPYGENIFWASWNSTPLDAVKLWLAEKPYYNYTTNSCKPGKMCGHYTQIVWKTTTKVGCASAKCPAGGTFTVCSYNPPGNYIGERPY